jgi:TatD DNase family protein
MIGDAGAAVAAARSAGIEAIVTIGIDVATSRLAIELAERYPGVYATVGMHPHDAEGWDEDALRELESLARLPRVVAVGECGLDYFRNLSPRDAQRRAFLGQIDLARRLELPLVVHIRDAGEEALALLAEHAADLTVIMHCFSLADAVDLCNERGYYASFAGNVTYKNAADLREAAGSVREDRLLIETDAPYLAPVPHRGAENTPALVALTAATVAGARGCDVERVAAVTTANARRVFGLAETT